MAVLDTLMIAWLAAGDGPQKGAVPHFVDATKKSGVAFTCKGGSGRLLVLDTMGAGLAAADFDGDGDDDLYLLTGSQLDPYGKGEKAPSNRLWRNDGGLRFTDVTKDSGTGLDGWSFGAVAGDYDGDGDLDLHVTRYGPDVLLRNDGNLHFTDVTAAAGVGDKHWGTGAVFFDYDRDGDLDLYVVNYVDFEARLARYGGDLDHKDFKDFKQLPQYFNGEPNTLFRNNGDSTFTDVTAQARVADEKGKGLGAVACDFDEDGDQDLYVANDTTPNSLFVNRGDGKFDELAADAGVALGATGRAQGTMGVGCGDLDGDGRFDLVITTFDNEPDTLYRNTGDMLFEDETRRRGLHEPTLRPVGWASEPADFDCDGDLDLFFSNGHVVTDVPLFLIRYLIPADRLPGVVEPEHFDGSYRQKQQLFLNDGKGVFSEAGKAAGAPFDEEMVGRGAVAADLDRDGDLDLVLQRSNETTLVLENEGTPKNGWLELELADPGKNRFGVGARVEVTAGGRTQVRQVSCGDSYCSQRPLALHFGLGAGDPVAEVKVRWPDGAVQWFHQVKPRQRVRLRREEGQAQ
jgi:enediyne biosynthesis protein E4